MTHSTCSSALQLHSSALLKEFKWSDFEVENIIWRLLLGQKNVVIETVYTKRCRQLLFLTPNCCKPLYFLAFDALPCFVTPRQSATPLQFCQKAIHYPRRKQEIYLLLRLKYVVFFPRLMMFWPFLEVRARHRVSVHRNRHGKCGGLTIKGRFQSMHSYHCST